MCGATAGYILCDNLGMRSTDMFLPPLPKLGLVLLLFDHRNQDFRKWICDYIVVRHSDCDDYPVRKGDYDDDFVRKSDCEDHSVRNVWLRCFTDRSNGLNIISCSGQSRGHKGMSESSSPITHSRCESPRSTMETKRCTHIEHGMISRVTNSHCLHPSVMHMIHTPD